MALTVIVIITANLYTASSKFPDGNVKQKRLKKATKP